MSADSGDKRPVRAPGAMSSHPPPKLNDPLPCPRCESTTTKFCYYNNYNLSQPRYFCKSCRRYWTQGGTLRNVPVGGGTRKTSKRSRSSSVPSPVSTSSSSAVTQEAESVPMSAHPVSVVPAAGVKSEMSMCDVNLNETVGGEPGPGSFTSFLTAPGQGYLTLGGYGLGTGPGFDGVWGYHGNGYMGSFAAGPSVGCNPWQMTAAGDIEGGGALAEGDYFGWPGLAISAHGKGMK
ncbi:hypothetical protein SLA2020_308490 [Shorea laevis]